jgi:hypothetical protein
MPICGIVCRTDYLHDLVGGDQIAIESCATRQSVPGSCEFRKFQWDGW